MSLVSANPKVTVTAGGRDEALPATIATPAADDPLGVTIHRLSNGLTVYLSTYRREPRFQAWIAIRAGARHDPPKSTGLAHYLEHMMFKGSSALGTLDFDRERPHLDRIAQLYDELRVARAPRRRDALLAEIDAETQRSAAVAIPNELDRVFASLGVIDVNAFTAAEETVYISDVPAGSLAPWARLERARFTDPVFRLFYPELESVYEEKNMSLDDPHERIYEDMMAALFGAHPYGTQPTLGRGEHLKSPAYADMVAFFQRWYAPNNAAIVLAGDIDAAVALPVLEREFADWRPRPLPPRALGEPAHAPRGRVLRTVRAEGEQSVTVAWRTTPLGHADTPALRVLDRLVDNATCGLLNVKLRLSQKVPDAHASGEHRLEAGYWSMTASARADQALDEVEALLLEIIRDLQAGDFSDEDLAAIKLHARIHDKRALESNESRAARMAEAFTTFQAWPDYAKRTVEMERVSKADIVRVARRYLGGDFVVVRRERGLHEPPQIRTPKITPVPIDPERESALAREVRALPTTPPEPVWLREGVDFTTGAIATGPYIFAPNTLSDLFTVSFAFRVGLRQAPLMRYALDMLERAGVSFDGHEIPAPELQRAFYRLGTTVDTWCGPDLTTVSVSGVRKNLNTSISLLERWMNGPRFDAEDLQRMLQNRLSRRHGELREPDSVANALADYVRHGARGWTRLRPSNALLASTTVRRLQLLLESLTGLARSTLYFGPSLPADERWQLELGSRHNPPEAFEDPPPRPPLSLRQVPRTTIFFVHKQTAQAQVQVALPRPPLPRSARPLARLYDHYLGGDMSGLVFQELREARGLAYAATARHEVGLRVDDPSTILGLAGTQGDKVALVTRLLLELMRRPPLQPARVAAVRDALLEEHRSTRIDPRSVPRRVYRWRALGEQTDPRPDQLAALAGYTAADLQRFVDEVDTGAEQRPAIIGVMGDRAQIDLDALAGLGELVERTPEELFSFGAFPAEFEDE